MDASNEWITTRIGIKFRHVTDENEKTDDLAAESTRHTLTAAGISVDKTDLIIAATATSDMQLPSIATIVRHRLGATSDCPVFDAQTICTGFMYALSTADAYVRSGMAKKVLIISAETFSRILNWSNRTTCASFGDGIGAVALGAVDEPSIIHGKLQADGNYLDLFNISGQIANNQICGTSYIKIDDLGIFKFAVKMLAKVAEEVIRKAGMALDQVD